MEYLDSRKRSRSISFITITIKNTITIGCHYSAADLSMLSDFRTSYINNFNIVNISFVTFYDIRDKTLTNYGAIQFRDTTLLAAPGQNSLEAVGKIVGVNKLKIGEWIFNMKEYLKEHYEDFKGKFLDSIPLTHMNDSYVLKAKTDLFRLEKYMGDNDKNDTEIILSAKYNDYKYLIVRRFILLYFERDLKWFKNRKEMVAFIKGFDIHVTINEKLIFNIKYRKTAPRGMPANVKGNEAFIDYIIHHRFNLFMDFNYKDFTS